MKHITSKLKYFPIFAFFAASVAFATDASSRVTVSTTESELEYYISGSEDGAMSVTADGSIEKLTGSFTNNANNANTGILSNASSSGVTINEVAYGIGYVETDFIYNITSLNGTGSVGAISNSGKIYTIDADFILNTSKNTATKTGGAVIGLISNAAGTIEIIKGNFISNSASTVRDTSNSAAVNGFISNTGTIGSMDVNVSGNKMSTVAGNAQGFLFNQGTGTIGSVTGNFSGNSSTATTGSAYASAIRNAGTIYEVSSNFIANETTSNSAANAYAGAVYNDGTIGFLASTSNMTFAGNTVKGVSNAIYNTSQVNFNAYNGYEISVNDGISGTTNGSTTGIIAINNTLNSTDYTYYSSTNYSTVSFNNNVTNQTVTVYAGTLNLGGHDGGDTYTWTTYSDYDTDTGALTEVSNSYTTEASIASLTNTKITVNSGATLQIGTTSQLSGDGSYSVVSVNGTSSITLSSGSTLLMDAYASLSFTDTASLTYTDGAAFVIDLADFLYELEGENSYALFTFTDDSSASALYDYLTTDDNFTILNGTGELSYETGASSIYLSVSSTAVPEPSTYAMIVGALALGFAYYRRRK